jgi:hypothetical protein
MIDGGCHDQTGLEALALSGFEDGSYGLAIIVDSNSC